MTTPSGWYTNPEDPLQERYWDGSMWSDQTRPKAPAAPPAGPPAGSPVYGSPYPQPATAAPVGYDVPNKTNALILAVISTVCGCLPLGIWSIILATQIDTHLTRGDIAGARHTARKSRNVAIWSIGVGVALVVGQIAFSILVAAAGQ